MAGSLVFHLQVRPGADAFALAALLAVLAEEHLLDRAFVASRTTGVEEVLAALAEVPVPDSCARAGLPEARVRAVARRSAAAPAVAAAPSEGIASSPP